MEKKKILPVTLGSKTEAYYMGEALKEAMLALQRGTGRPYGCVIARGDSIIGEGYDQTRTSNNLVKHAAITAIGNACFKVKEGDLTGCTAYLTVRPCKMCREALKRVGIQTIVYAKDEDDLSILGLKGEEDPEIDVQEIVLGNEHVNSFYIDLALLANSIGKTGDK